LAALGRHPYRPAHLHFMFEAAGYQPLVTHLFVPDDPYLHSDAVFGVKESLVVEVRRVEDPAEWAAAGMASPYHAMTHDFVLARC
jgi:hydroxyquinol 1,2-dioxygenase